MAWLLGHLGNCMGTRDANIVCAALLYRRNLVHHPPGAAVDICVAGPHHLGQCGYEARQADFKHLDTSFSPVFATMLTARKSKCDYGKEASCDLSVM
jgi:hypothetical protein